MRIVDLVGNWARFIKRAFQIWSRSANRCITCLAVSHLAEGGALWIHIHCGQVIWAMCLLRRRLYAGDVQQLLARAIVHRVQGALVARPTFRTCFAEILNYIVFYFTYGSIMLTVIVRWLFWDAIIRATALMEGVNTSETSENFSGLHTAITQETVAFTETNIFDELKQMTN